MLPNIGMFCAFQMQRRDGRQQKPHGDWTSDGKKLAADTACPFDLTHKEKR